MGDDRGEFLQIAVGARNVYALVTFAFVGFSGAANKFEFWYGIRARHKAHGEDYVTALVRLMGSNRRRYGGYVAHLGILMVALGVAASSSFRSSGGASGTFDYSAVTGSGAALASHNRWKHTPGWGTPPGSNIPVSPCIDPAQTTNETEAAE